jgi:hypothetical protein
MLAFPLAIPDVQFAIVLGHTQLRGLFRRHEIEHPGGANGPEDRRGASTVFNGGVRLARFCLSGMVKHLAG